MKKVEVTKQMFGICHMQVCCAEGVGDAEILAACNAENPSGTSGGWSRVIRQPTETERERGQGPVRCRDHEGRTHFLVAC